MEKNEIKHNWNKMAMAYDDFTSSPKSYSNMIEWPNIKKLLPELHDKVILDLGCGTGRFSFLFEEFRPLKVVGVDFSEEMIRIAKETAMIKDSKINFIQGDVTNLSFIKSDSMDLIFSSTVLHFIDDLQKVMKEIYRILKPNGNFLLSVIHPVYSAQYPIKNEIETFPEDKDWRVRYLIKSIRAYCQPWIEYNPEIDNFLTYSYHHTMSDYVNNIIESGMIIRTLLEPLPPEEFKLKSLSRYNSYIETPTYAIFKSTKP